MRHNTLPARILGSAKVRAQAGGPLLRGGYALLLSSGLTSALGLAYWALAARMLPPAEVGLSSALVSALLLVSGVAQLSMVNVLTRFVPRAGAATARLVGGTYLLTTGAAALAGSIFALGTPLWAPALALLAADWRVALWFVLAAMVWCVFTLQDAALAGLRQAGWVPLENALFALAKIGLLAGLAWSHAPLAIFASWTAPGAAAALAVSALLFRRLIPRHAAGAPAELPPARELARYAAGNYLGSLLSLAVTTLLPLAVVHRLGPSANAFFAQPWLIATSLQLVAGNMAVALTVEASADRARLAEHTRRALAQSARLLAPMAGALALAAPLVLGLFGAAYAAEGAPLLRLLALGSLPNMVVTIYLGVARVRGRAGEIVALQAALSALTLGLSHLLLPQMGIAGVGAAWLAAQLAAAAWVVATGRLAARRLSGDGVAV